MPRQALPACRQQGRPRFSSAFPFTGWVECLRGRAWRFICHPRRYSCQRAPRDCAAQSDPFLCKFILRGNSETGIRESPCWIKFQSPAGTRPLDGPLRGANVMGTSEFRFAVPEPDKQLSSTQNGHQERPHQPREQAGHLN